MTIRKNFLRSELQPGFAGRRQEYDYLAVMGVRPRTVAFLNLVSTNWEDDTRLRRANNKIDNAAEDEYESYIEVAASIIARSPSLRADYAIQLSAGIERVYMLRCLKDYWVESLTDLSPDVRGNRIRNYDAGLDCKAYVERKRKAPR